MKKGAVTAFLSLIFILLMSVVMSLVESASVQVIKNRKRGDMDRAMESIFAEYQKNLLEDFDVFALDGTYESGDFQEENLLKRLEFYGMKDADMEIEKMQLLTDDSGRAFREQVVSYMKHKLGIAEIEELAGLTGEWKNQKDQVEQYEEEEKEISLDLEQALQNENQVLPENENPIKILSFIKEIGFSRLVMKENDISKKAVASEEMLVHRSLKKGRGDFKIRDDTTNSQSNLLFASYAIEKFRGADDPYKEGNLEYEIEYILQGKNNDRENLEGVLRKLSTIRFVSNYGYLLTDAEKKAEADAMALTLATLVALPSLKGLIKQAILFAWAFGESIMDLRSLIAGGRIPLKKSREEWQLSLSGLLKLGTSQDVGAGQHSEKGLSYKEYLRLLLLLEKQEECTMRTLGILELRMKKTLGEFFQADLCVSKLNVRAKCKIRGKIHYKFSTEYGYQ